MLSGNSVGISRKLCRDLFDPNDGESVGNAPVVVEWSHI